MSNRSTRSTPHQVESVQCAQIPQWMNVSRQESAHAAVTRIEGGGAAARPHETEKSSELILTQPALEIHLELHSGERALLLPLESVEGGASLLEDMIGGLQEAAEKTLGGILPRSRALAAREVARQQPGTSF